MNRTRRRQKLHNSLPLLYPDNKRIVDKPSNIPVSTTPKGFVKRSMRRDN